MTSFTSKIGASSMTPAGNNMAWVMHYCNSSMYLYTYNDLHNKDVKENMSVTVNISGGIHDMAIKDGEMIVTCGDKKVRRISLSGGVSEIINTEPFVCGGVCVTDKNKIVVCMRGQVDKNQNHVAEYSSDGRSKLREIRGRDGQGKQQIIEPYRVVQNGQKLCVVNQGHNVVCVDNMNGEFQWMYKDEGAKHDEPFNPLGICVDKENNFLVSDHYNRVYQINREGKLLKVILTDLMTQEGSLFQRYWGICVDDTGRVWIGNAEKDIVIAELKNKSDEN